MALKQKELGVLLAIKYPSPVSDNIFELLFDNEIAASVALAKITGFSPIPCYEFRWFYDHELPAPIGTPQHRAIHIRDCDGTLLYKLSADKEQDLYLYAIGNYPEEYLRSVIAD